MRRLSYALSAVVLGAAALGGVLAGGAQAASLPRQDLFQVHADGSIWHYTGTPMTGWTKIADNPAIRMLATSDNGSHTYELDMTGTLWSYTSPPITGWGRIDDNRATVEAVAGGGGLAYQVHSDGTIWRSPGTPGAVNWVSLGRFTGVKELAVNGGTDGNAALYAALTNGDVYQKTSGGWRLLDHNPATATVATNDTANSAYQMHTDGTIWRYTGTPITGWQEIADHPLATHIAAGPSAGSLYEVDKGGNVWKYTGTPMTGWVKLDNNPATTEIEVGDDGSLYEFHALGRSAVSIWLYTGTPMTGWTMLDDNPAAAGIIAGASRSMM